MNTLTQTQKKLEFILTITPPSCDSSHSLNFTLLDFDRIVNSLTQYDYAYCTFKITGEEFKTFNWIPIYSYRSIQHINTKYFESKFNFFELLTELFNEYMQINIVSKIFFNHNENFAISTNALSCIFETKYKNLLDLNINPFLALQFIYKVFDHFNLIKHS